MLTLTKKDLIALGYGNSYASSIIRQAKHLMVKKGFTFYDTRKLGRVPVESVEDILGIQLTAEVLSEIGNTSGISTPKEV